MGALRVWLAALSLAISAPAGAESVADWRPHSLEASARFGIPVAWIEAVMRAESGGRRRLNGRPIRSSAGAMGLMQLMPSTWAAMRSRLGLGTDPDNPRDNILAGTFYLRLMYDRFGYPGLFAAYNAGPARYAAHLAGRRALPGETVRYLASVAPAAPAAPAAAVVPARRSPPPSIFAVRKDAATDAPAKREERPSSGLFVALSRDD